MFWNPVDGFWKRTSGPTLHSRDNYLQHRWVKCINVMLKIKAFQNITYIYHSHAENISNVYRATTSSTIVHENSYSSKFLKNKIYTL